MQIGRALLVERGWSLHYVRIGGKQSRSLLGSMHDALDTPLVEVELHDNESLGERAKGEGETVERSEQGGKKGERERKGGRVGEEKLVSAIARIFVGNQGKHEGLPHSVPRGSLQRTPL